jgi:hypothetical protein
MNPDLGPFFRAEQSDLLKDLHELPRNAAVRKINELVKRARMAKVHALIIGHLKAQMPMFGQQSKQKALLDNLADEFFAIMKKHRLPQGDFPNLARFKEVASSYDFAKFAKYNEKLIDQAENALSVGIPQLLRQLGEEADQRTAVEKEKQASFFEGTQANQLQPAYTGNEGRMTTKEYAGGGAGAGSPPEAPRPTPGPAEGNPFGGGAGPRDPQSIWAAFINKVDSDSVFRLLPGGQEGLVSGAGAKDVLLESGLDVNILRQIWDLADIDKDGCLDRDEFAVCWWLLNQAKGGKPIPTTLPANIVPPSKKQ